MSLVKHENVELHKRIDQLEVLVSSTHLTRHELNYVVVQCKTCISSQQIHLLQEHVRQLEQDNERLAAENRRQRDEYEHFLEQLTPMVLRTAIMQEVGTSRSHFDFVDIHRDSRL